jgi:SAM-dependent methyltransferase
MAIRPSKLLRYAIAGWLPGGRRVCVMCGHRVWRFMPYREGARGAPPLMRVLGMVGSNPNQFECPRCGAHDRERHLLLYLRASGLLDDMRGKSILHFAPEKRLSGLMRAAQPAQYLRCDLYPQSADVRCVDMLNMEFAPNTFDVVIANHVLEHVDDVDKALSEVWRVLKPGGCAILQTPYGSKLRRTWSDPGIDTDAARLQAYGQEDHLRLFGSDIFERFAESGLDPDIRLHAELLPEYDAIEYGVNPDEPLFLFHKRGRD